MVSSEEPERNRLVPLYHTLLTDTPFGDCLTTLALRALGPARPRSSSRRQHEVLTT